MYFGSLVHILYFCWFNLHQIIHVLSNIFFVIRCNYEKRKKTLNAYTSQKPHCKIGRCTAKNQFVFEDEGLIYYTNDLAALTQMTEQSYSISINFLG